MGWSESPDEYWKRVETHANDALRLDEADVRARILLARSYIAYNRYAEAQAQIDRAVAINPERRGRARRARQHPHVAG